MLELKSLNIEAIPIYQEFHQRWPRQSCDYNISNLIAWGQIYNDQYLLWQDNLVVFNPKFNSVLFPLGENFTPQELAELMMKFDAEFHESELILIPEEYIINHPDIENYFSIQEYETWADYVYSCEKLVQLPGKKLAKKKNLISQFRRNYPDYHVLKIRAENKEVIISFAAKWKRERNIEGIYLNTELIALQNTMEHWDELPVEGLIICYQDRIAAFSIFSEQTSDMVTIHYEKYDPDKKGAAQTINWEVAKYLLSRYKWINREQDMGLEGLKQAKSSYIPDFMVKFYAGNLSTF